MPPAAAPFDLLVLLPPADGLEALSTVLAKLPPDLPVAVLVASSLGGKVAPAEVLGHHTPLPVHPAEHGTVLQPGHVYVSLPQTMLEVRPDGRCLVTPSPPGEFLEGQLDRLLALLAVGFGERTLVVVLGGTGPDGVAGARALRGAGGTVLVQDPTTADAAELPSALVDTRTADVVRPLSDLGRTVTALLLGRPVPRLAAARTEQRAEEILERMGEAHCVLDREYRIRSVNAAAERLLGVSRTHLLGRSHWEAFPASVDAPIGHALRRVVEEGAEQHLTHHYTGEGYDLHLEVDAYPTGKGGVAMFWRDVTARVQAEQASRASEERYRTLFTEMDEAYAVVEVMKGEAGRWTDFLFLEVNAAFMQHTGMPYPVGRMATELLGTPNPRWAELCGLVAETGEAIRVEESELTLGRVFDLNIFHLGGEGSRRVAVLFTDITGRKRAEEALRQSEERRLLGLEAAGIGDWVYDTATRILDCSPQARAMHGVAPGEPVTLELHDHLIDPEDRAAVRSIRAQALGDPSGKGHRVEFRLRPVGGGMRWIESVGRAVFEETPDGPQATHLIGAMIDITERKRREANQALLIEISSDLSQPFIEEELLHTVGAKLTAHLGLTCYHYVDVDEDRAEVTVRHFWHALNVPSVLGTYPIDGFIPQDELSDRRAGRTSVIHDVKSDPPDDTAATAALRAGAGAQKIGAYIAVPYSQDGRWQAYFAVADSRARDWTGPEVELVQEVASRLFPRVERARAEAAHRASEARFRAVANLVPDLLWESRPGGLTPWYNQRWLDYTGQTPEQATGWGWTDAVHPDDRERSAQRYGQAVQAGQPLRQEHRIRRHDGQYRWFVVNTFPVRDERGEVALVYGAATDIHHLRVKSDVLEARVEERTRRLADLNAELGNVIIRTAHNLEAPARRLGRVLDPGRPLDSEALNTLSSYDPAALRDEVTRLRGIAQDLRQLARLEQQDVAKELLPLGELLEAVRAGVATTPRGSQVHWLISPLPIVRGDRALLRQALEVLMTFTLSETRGARYVTVSSQEVEGEVQVTVEDDGLGLTGEEAATLFDLAVRTDQSVPVLEGSGLVQVRRILARHGGWAWAEAQRTRGKVILAFPRDEVVNELEDLFRQDNPGR